MRVSWYADTGVAVFSIWQGDTCTGTFRLPIPELPRMVEALTQGPPGRAGSGSRGDGPGLRQADSGPATTAMGPGCGPAPEPGQPAGDYLPPYRDHEETPLDRGRVGPLAAGHPGSPPGAGYPDPQRGPGQDFPPQRGYGTPDAGDNGLGGSRGVAPGGASYREVPPTAGYTGTGQGGYQEGPPTARYTGTGPGSYQGPAPGGQDQVPANGYYQEAAPEGHHDQPPGGYYHGFAPEGQGHRDQPPGGFYGGFAPEGQGPRDQPPGGYHQGPGSPAPGGYQNLPPGGYQDLPPGGGYRDVPPGADYRPHDDGYREPPAAAAPAGSPAQFAGRQQDPYPPTGPLPVGRWRTDEPSGEFPQARPEDGFAEDTSPADRFAADEFAPDGYAGEGFAPDEFGADGLHGDPLADSYQGEAEQGYLPSPPTDMFPAASLSGGHDDQGGHRAGYEPDPADLDHGSPYPPGRADRGGLPRDSGTYRPGRGGAREREYGHSRGRC